VRWARPWAIADSLLLISLRPAGLGGRLKKRIRPSAQPTYQDFEPARSRSGSFPFVIQLPVACRRVHRWASRTDSCVFFYLFILTARRLGDEERRLMHLVPAPAVRLMKRRVLSRPGLTSEVSKAWAAAARPLTSTSEPNLIRRSDSKGHERKSPWNLECFF